MLEMSLVLQLLNYAATTMLYTDRNVNNNLITWNKVILLHGNLYK